MSGQRLNKAQKRRLKQKQRKLRAQKRAIKQNRLSNQEHDSVFKYKENTEWVQGSDLFPASIPLEKRREIIASIIEDSKKEYADTLPKLKEWFREFDSTYLVSFYSFYFMSQKEGTTNEHEGDFEHYQHYVEILQAISLTLDRTYEVKPLNEKAPELEKQMSRVGMVTQFAFMDITKDDGDDVVRRKSMIAQVRNNTAAIRNWAYHFQMEKVTVELMANIDEKFNEVYGIKSGDLARILFEVPKIVNENFSAHRKKLIKFVGQKKKDAVIAAYEEQFPDVVKLTKVKFDELFNMLGKSVKQLKLALISHSDLRLPEIYSFTAKELIKRLSLKITEKKLEEILDKLSYKYGDLKSQEPMHIVLDNPIHKRPFIKTDDHTYFCPSVASVPHFAIEMIEELILGDSSLTERYTKVKGEYCEKYVSEILSRNFTHAKLYQNIKWKRSDIPGEEFETDNLLIAGSFALILESKSGKLSPPGRRGAEERLQKHIDELILEPSRQANNFIDAVKTGVITDIRDSSGKLSIDFSELNYFIPVSITLENLGLLTDARNIVKASMNKELPPEKINLCMTMTDLECIFEILKIESMRLHYLIRRREFAMHIDFMGDEMDLLGFYLEKGFNIGDTEYNGDLHMQMTMQSTNIDKYFMLVDEYDIKPPKNYLTSGWEALLTGLASRKPNGWVEASFALLNCDHDDQLEFNKKATRLISDFKRGKLHSYPKNPYMVILAGPKKRRIVVAFYPFRGLGREKRNNTIADILSDSQFQDCKIKLAFGVDVDKPNQPYAVMAITKDSVLMEEPVEFIEYKTAEDEPE